MSDHTHGQTIVKSYVASNTAAFEKDVRQTTGTGMDCHQRQAAACKQRLHALASAILDDSATGTGSDV